MVHGITGQGKAMQNMVENDKRKSMMSFLGIYTRASAWQLQTSFRGRPGSVSCVVFTLKLIGPRYDLVLSVNFIERSKAYQSLESVVKNLLIYLKEFRHFCNFCSKKNSSITLQKIGERITFSTARDQSLCSGQIGNELKHGFSVWRQEVTTGFLTHL